MPPTPLYKYSSLADDVQWKRLEALLHVGQIYLSSPDQFNDLFDVWPEIVVPKANDPAYLKRLNEAGRRLGHGASARRRQIAYLTGVSQKAHAARFTERALKRLRAVGIFCVTPHNDSQLMWAHYGANHQGICVGFHANRGPLAAAQRVRYSDVAPCYNHLVEDLKEFASVFLTKGRQWEYEDEYRLVSFDLGGKAGRMKAMEGLEHDGDICRFIGREPGPGLHNMSRDLIASITFGRHCPEADRLRIAAIAAREGLALPLFEVVVDDAARALRAQPWAP